MKINFREIPEDGEVWEQFSQEFLSLQGLATESPPDRGPDGGKDMLMIEQVSGPLHKSSFRWLVSCKHFAGSDKAVSEVSHELNILERVKAFKADGFLGMYSTLPTAGLNGRLRQLVDANEISSYRIFSGRLIESELLAVGNSWLIRRYFPQSYKLIRPLHRLLDEFVEIKCEICGRDLLDDNPAGKSGAVIAFCYPIEDSDERLFVDIYWACKRECDRKMQERMLLAKQATAWEDISDLIMPNQFLRWIFAHLNTLREGQKYSDAAFGKLKKFIAGVSQKVFREITEGERSRLRELQEFGF